MATEENKLGGATLSEHVPNTPRDPQHSTFSTARTNLPKCTACTTRRQVRWRRRECKWETRRQGTTTSKREDQYQNPMRQKGTTTTRRTEQSKSPKKKSTPRAHLSKSGFGRTLQVLALNNKGRCPNRRKGVSADPTHRCRRNHPSLAVVALLNTN